MKSAYDRCPICGQLPKVWHSDYGRGKYFADCKCGARADAPSEEELAGSWRLTCKNRLEYARKHERESA